ncbi:hypothetical protein M406DRAFT_68345 [Cryphonectria parasitica EP155]|uniref:Uncharacterized protein n=1 Tax=Cryphonectria parasitica (strain ATCC 38755 / EP155) TaxID=660469 RepID=A0A9P5CNZ1_CRYP1|nr:uncharacterized protein M406DRAFT_68345 [Cryphonectria parasitica EP155]KAF3765964.1 hypothetical protein M406DRAFT_68345 [Cryphonectria parasitica EP155]
MAKPNAFKQDWNEAGLYRDVLIATLEHSSLSKGDIIQIAEKAKAIGGWEFSASGLYNVFSTESRILSPLSIMSDRTVWTAQAHQDLLVAIVTNITLTDVEWKKINPELCAKGYNYTYKAAVQHLQKLKRKETASGGGNSEPSSSKKSTPAKRVRQTADDDEETPTKKGRTSAGGKKKKTPASESVKQEENFEGYAVKHEPTEYDDDGDV